jgi:hypothetical protein
MNSPGEQHTPESYPLPPLLTTSSPLHDTSATKITQPAPSDSVPAKVPAAPPEQATTTSDAQETPSDPTRGSGGLVPDPGTERHPTETGITESENAVEGEHVFQHSGVYAIVPKVPLATGLGLPLPTRQTEGVNLATKDIGHTSDERQREIIEWQNKNEVLNHQIKELQRRLNFAQSANNNLRARIETLDASIVEVKTERDRYVKANTELQTHKGKWDTSKTSLKAQLTEYMNAYNSLVPKYNQLYHDNEAYFKKTTELRTQLNDSKDETELLKRDNESASAAIDELRRQIFADGNGNNPQHPDVYYIENLQKLHYSLEQQILDLSDDQSQSQMPDQDQIFETLKGLGSRGEETVKLLSTTEFSLSTKFYTTILTQHVAALYLLKKIFEPITVAEDPHMATWLHSVVRGELKGIGDLERKGGTKILFVELTCVGPLTFDEVLTLNKVMGRKIVELELQTRVKDEERLTEEMSQTLQPFLPFTGLIDIKTKMRGIIKKSLKLKDELATERTLCSFIWHSAGAANPEWIEAQDYRTDLLCTFFGICGERSVWRERRTVVVAKARAVSLEVRAY